LVSTSHNLEKNVCEMKYDALFFFFC